jgi:hypothetical protein
MILCPLLFLNLPNFEISNDVVAESTWYQNNDSEFNQGTCERVQVLGTGEQAEVCLEAGGWVENQPVKDPYSVYYTALASVYGTDKAVLFGGAYTNQTWIYDQSDDNWTQVFTAFTPSNRSRHAMATIYGTDQVLLFGGTDGNFEFDDTWIYDLGDNTWTLKSLSTRPSPRIEHGMCAIFGTNKVLLYGGNDGGNDGETWVYDLSDNRWTRKYPSTSPGGRNNHALAYIHGTDNVVMFGGIPTYNYETWVYDLSDNIWTRKTPDDHPSPRRGHAMATLHNTDKILLFGGYYYGYLNDTWYYDYNSDNWYRTYPTISPDPIDDHVMAIIYDTAEVMLYDTIFQKTWTYNCSTPYQPSGIFTSSSKLIVKDSTFLSISWDAIEPSGTSVRFQLRSANTESDLYQVPFLGPDGDSSSYYISSPAYLWHGHNNDSWVQYKTIFRTYNPNLSPRLRNVSIVYNNLPIVQPESPFKKEAISNNKPTFKWSLDDDSDGQNAFQIQIDNNQDLQSIEFKSGIQISNNKQWKFPKGTIYSNLPEGTWFWRIRVQDSDGGWGPFSAPWQFTIDSKPPESMPSKSLHNKFFNGIDTITGNASEVDNGTGINRVEISIKRISDGYYWSDLENIWTTEEIWLDTEGKEQWEYNCLSVVWNSSEQYIIESRAIDKAGNIEEPGSWVVVNLDMTPPNSIITYPVDESYVPSLDAIIGNASDDHDSGIQIIEVSIKRTWDDHYWNGVFWERGIKWLPAEGTEQWFFNLDYVLWNSETQYYITSRGTDNVGNIEKPDYGTTFTYDDLPPNNPTIKINDDDIYTNDTLVTLTLGNQEPVPEKCIISFSNDGVTWLKDEVFSETKIYELPNIDGEKNVYFKLCDLAGNFAVANDSIILDAAPPYALSISINNGSLKTSSRSVHLTLNATDDTSGVSEMAFSTDGINWSAWEPFVSESVYTLPSIDGEKTIYFMVRDRAQNIAREISAKIFLDTTESKIVTEDPGKSDDFFGSFEFWSIIIILIIVVIIIIALLVIRRRTKQTDVTPTATQVQPPSQPQAQVQPQIQPQAQIQPQPQPQYSPQPHGDYQQEYDGYVPPQDKQPYHDPYQSQQPQHSQLKRY